MMRFLSSLIFSVSLFSCQQLGEQPLLDEVCTDGVDNDLNELTDCEDLDACQGEFACRELCEDNLDNDFDGFADCDDDDCSPTNACLCAETQVLLSNQLPIAFEGDTADGVDAVNILGCQTGDALESSFHLSFPDLLRVDVAIEPLDGVPMVLQNSTSCQDSNNSAFGCAPGGDREGLDVSSGSILFFVGAREAGQTGRFRITFSAPQ